MKLSDEVGRAKPEAAMPRVLTRGSLLLFNLNHFQNFLWYWALYLKLQIDLKTLSCLRIDSITYKKGPVTRKSSQALDLGINYNILRPEYRTLDPFENDYDKASYHIDTKALHLLPCNY